MFLRTGQGPKIRAEAGKPGSNTAHHSRGNGKQAKARKQGAGAQHCPRGNGKQAKARNPGPISPYSKRPRLKSGAFFIFAS